MDYHETTNIHDLFVNLNRQKWLLYSQARRDFMQHTNIEHIRNTHPAPQEQQLSHRGGAVVEGDRATISRGMGQNFPFHPTLPKIFPNSLKSHNFKCIN